MTKKHFIALADFIKHVYVGDSTQKLFKESHLEVLASFCAYQNPRFNRARWLGYIKGENGPHGGRVRI